MTAPINTGGIIIQDDIAFLSATSEFMLAWQKIKEGRAIRSHHYIECCEEEFNQVHKMFSRLWLNNRDKALTFEELPKNEPTEYFSLTYTDYDRGQQHQIGVSLIKTIEL